MGLALLRGLRRGELAGLKWSAVDLNVGTVRVERARLSVDGVAVESDVKTASGRRTVPLDPQLVALLRAHDRQQKSERLRAGEAWQGDDHLVANELGSPYHPEALAKRFQVLVKATGLPRVRFHDLRHSCASLLMAEGVNAKVVQELLGHSSVQITLALYSHVAPSMGREAGAALSASLLGEWSHLASQPKVELRSFRCFFGCEQVHSCELLEAAAELDPYSEQVICGGVVTPSGFTNRSQKPGFDQRAQVATRCTRVNLGPI